MSSSSQWRSELPANDDDDLGEDEDLQVEKLSTGRDCLIFLLDASPSMHVIDEDGVTPFQKCIEAIVVFMKGKVISNQSDVSGVVLYGTATAKNSHSFDNIYVAHDLDIPFAQRISDLEQLYTKPPPNDPNIGVSDQYAFHEALWICNTMFAKNSKKYDTKRVFIMTANDNPTCDDPNLFQSADLTALGAVLHLFSVCPTGTTFNFARVFKDHIIRAQIGDEETQISNKPQTLENLMKTVNQKEVKKRVSFRVPLKLSDGLELGVAGYGVVTEAKAGNYTYLVAATNEEAKVVTSYVCSTTAEQLSMTDMNYYYDYGGQKSIFTKDELSQIRAMGDPGLILLGFKPLEAVFRKPYYNVGHSLFVFPDEQSYSGSSSLFMQLVARTHALGKVMICTFIPRKSSTAKLVALIPQIEEHDEFGEQVKPSGFQLIHLPFTDDIRKPPATLFSNSAGLKESVTAFSNIVSKLSFKHYHVDEYLNPTLQKHYANLQAVALRQDMASEVHDSTMPDVEMIVSRAGNMIEEFKAIVDSVADTSESPGSKKRKADDQPNQAKKRAAVDPEKVRDMWSGETLHRLTVPMLTDFLHSVRVKPNKKKDDLISQVKAYFEKGK
ncbi:X-ray repair cross-complementing protein 6 [Chytridiales sp. JEL 0842]|nr:X-ray repair cross-complementing protein 6 [Chytridiales sp. JEL 0842]